MNEMNERYSSPSEAIGTLPPRKTGNRGLLIGTAVLCVLAVVAVAVKLRSAPNPKTAVEAAFTATAAQQKAAVAQLYEKIPAARLLFEGRDAAETTDFVFTVTAVEENPYAVFANVILKDAVIHGSAESHPESGSLALETSVVLQDAQLINTQLFVSPELVAVGIPTFGQTVSFNPATFVQDYQVSALNALNPLDAQSLEMMQGVITGQMAYYNALSTLSTEQLQADLLPILKRALNNATYTYDNQSQKYVVNIPAADLKNTIADFYRYIYFESEIGHAMAGMISPLAAAEPGQSYERLMEEAIAEIERSLPEQDAVLTLDIKNGLIKTAQLSCEPPADGASPTPEAAANAITALTFDCSFDKDAETARLVLFTADGAGMTVDASGVFKDDAYTLDMTMALDSEYTAMTLPMTMRVAADGSYSAAADLTMDMGGDPVKLNLSFDGTALLEQDVLTLSLPDSRVYLSASNTATGALVFDLDYRSAPLTGVPTPPESTPLFSMDAGQLERLGAEYSVGYENLVGRLFSLLMS